MDYIELNNGIKIPMIGSGTNSFGKIDNLSSGELRGDSLEIDWAIESGYRHFDSAQVYRNEIVVGQGWKKSGIERSEFFITSKLKTVDGYRGDQWARESIAKSLENLQTDYIDLFLFHHPLESEEETVQVWRLLEEYYDKGVFSAIGVSNFQEHHLRPILEFCNIVPAVNQIESHVGKWNDALIQANKSHGIATVAWSPLAGINENNKKVLNEIGSKYGKSYAQVVLRYQIEREIIVIPKSHNKIRQAESLDIFDFELTKEDRERISKL